MPVNREVILGIKLNGVSFKIDNLRIDDDQSVYDYICNVSESGSSDGNGSYHISILNKDLIAGLPIGDWSLVEGYISYDWGGSNSYFIMRDKNGETTKRIFASSARGSASGFSLQSLTRAIFTKARIIVSEYPSAKIYNSCARFLDRQNCPIQKSLQRYLDRTDTEEIIGTFIKDTLKPLTEYIHRYRETVEILKNENNEKCKRLLNKINEECCKTIHSLNRPFEKFE